MRADDIRTLKQKKRAAAAGRLLLGEFKNWQDFLQPETDDYDRFKRRDLKVNIARFRTGISKEIQKFCWENFEAMTDERLEKLYLKIKERLGLEMPLDEFENEFSALKENSLAGAPRHCTVVISLWGLQTKYPEYMLSKDIIEALRLLRKSDNDLEEFSDKRFQEISERRDEVKALVRQEAFASRACVLSCFNLIEAALNGIAWGFKQKSERFYVLSNRNKKLIEGDHCSIKEKLLKYPKIITSRELWDEDDARVKRVLDEIKPYRNALVHASPFSYTKESEPDVLFLSTAPKNYRFKYSVDR